MSTLLPLLLFLIFIFCVAFIQGEGMWGASLRLINVVTAGLLATNFWEPVARIMERFGGSSFTYWWDFLALWVVFIVSLLVMRFLTRRLSQVTVRFLSLADRIGGVVFAICVGMVMVSFTTFTLHTAPLGQKFMFGGFDSGKPVIGQPDRKWLGFALKASKGSLSRRPARLFPVNFVHKYTTRRSTLENMAKTKGTFRPPPGEAAPRRINSKVVAPPEVSPDA